MFFFVFYRYKQQNFMYLAQLLVLLGTIIAPFFFLCNPSASNSAPPSTQNHFAPSAVNIYICKSRLFKN